MIKHYLFITSMLEYCHDDRSQVLTNELTPVTWPYNITNLKLLLLEMYLKAIATPLVLMYTNFKTVNFN